MTELRGMLGSAWFVEVLRPGGPVPEPHEPFVDSLHTAVSLTRTPSFEEGLVSGSEACEAWIANLKTPPEQTNLADERAAIEGSP